MALTSEQLGRIYTDGGWEAVERAVREDVLRELGWGVDVEALACECESDLFTDEGAQRMMGSAVRVEIIADALRTAVAQARVEWERERERKP